MPVADELKILLRAETKAAVKAMKKAQQQTDSLEGQMKSLAKGAVKSFGMYAAAAVSVRAVSKTLKESVAAYGVQIEAEQGLQAALRASGEAAEDLMPKLKGVASGIQGVTIYGDEAVLGIMQLAKSQGVATGKLKEASKGAIGLSEAYGMNLQSSMKMVALAMQGEYTMLQRYIPQLKAASTEAEKQAIVQKAMADGFDIAKAKADNGVAAMKQYANASGDLKEQLGQSVAEGVKPFVMAMTDYVSRTASAIGNTRELKATLDALQSGGNIGGDVENLTDQLELANRRRKELEASKSYLGSGGRRELEQLEQTIPLLEEQIQAKRAAYAAEQRYQALTEASAPAERERLKREKEIAQMNAIAADERLRIAQSYGDRIAQQEMSSLEYIEHQRQQALDEAAASYVRTGEEIAQINQYFDNLKIAEMEAMTEKQKAEEEKRSREILDILRTRSERRIELRRKQEIANILAGENEVKAEKKTTDEIIALYVQRAQQALSMYNLIGGMAMDVFRLQADTADASAQREINNINDQIEFRKAAGEQYADLQEQLAEKEDRLKRKQFNRDKKMRIADAVMAGAQGVVNVWSAHAANPVLAGILSAAVVGLTGAKVGKINEQQYQGLAAGGIVPAQGSGGGLYRLGDKNKAETVIPFDIRDMNTGGVTVNFNGPVIGAGGRDEVAQFIVESIKRGQRSGRVEKGIA